jgi:hypothetical protein
MGKGTKHDPVDLESYAPAPKATWKKAPATKAFFDLTTGTPDNPLTLDDDAPASQVRKTSIPASTSTPQTQKKASNAVHPGTQAVNSENSPKTNGHPSSARGLAHGLPSRTKAPGAKTMSVNSPTSREPGAGLRNSPIASSLNASSATTAAKSSSIDPTAPGGRLSSEVAPTSEFEPVHEPERANTKVATPPVVDASARTRLPYPMPYSHSEDEPEPQHTVQQGISIDRPPRDHSERADIEAKLVPPTSQQAETPAASRASDRSSIARDRQASSTIPIRSTPRPAARPATTANKAGIPASRWDRLEYVLGRTSRSPATNTVEGGTENEADAKMTSPDDTSVLVNEQLQSEMRPTEDKQPTPESRLTTMAKVSKQMTQEPSALDKPATPPLSTPTKQDRPTKLGQARKTASNVGLKRQIMRASALKMRPPPRKVVSESTRDTESVARTTPPAGKKPPPGNEVHKSTEEVGSVTRLTPAMTVPHECLQRSNEHTVEKDPATTHVAVAIDVRDLEDATGTIDERLRDQLRGVHQTHALRVRAYMRRQRLCFEREGLLRERAEARGKVLTPACADKFVQSSSPFKKLAPVQSFVEGKGAKSLHFSQEMFTRSRKKGVTSKITAPITKFRSTAVNVPPFRSYVSLSDSFLAENEKSMLSWPYVYDGIWDDSDDGLEQHYNMKNVTRKWHSLLADVHEFWAPSANALLADLEITWDDVLYWYLAPDSDIIALDKTLHPVSSDFQSIVRKRMANAWMDHQFDRRAPKWERLLLRIVPPTPRKLRVAALVCKSFENNTGFDFWHLARRSDFVRKETSRKLRGDEHEPRKFEYRKAMCRVCQMHHCLFHGELSELPEEDFHVAPDTQTSNSALAREEIHDEDSSDSDIEDVDNYRRAANSHTLATHYEKNEAGHQEAAMPPSDFKAQWWLNNTSAATWDERRPFYPCSHEGTCDQARCRCFLENITCEKSCECARSCKRRFPGCSCAQIGGKQRVCGTKACLCFAMNRECDGDLCGGCGANEILDPINRYKDEVSKGKCCNVVLQRGVPKKTLLGHSEVHGFGLYTGEEIAKDDFLGEYKGEIITIKEGERRAVVYDKQKTMYLFKLNKGQSLLTEVMLLADIVQNRT